MVIVDLQVENKVERPKFFQKIYLMANTKFEVILGIPFLKLSNTDILFNKKIFTWRTYTTNKALSTTKQIKIIDKKNFVTATFNANSKMFIMHIAIRE